MSANIDYYFTHTSPFTWLGHSQLVEIADKHSKVINFKPVNLMDVWDISGAVPPVARPPVRQRYRLIEIKRIAEMRGVPIIATPSNFPTNPELADRSAISICETGGNPAEFTFSVGEALWTQDRQIADEAVIADILTRTGHDAAAILAAAKSPKTAEIRAANTIAANKADAVGAPAYVYKNEVFWGQDRLDYLDQMIASGREAFSA